jgi:hypothetical protein
MANSFFTVDTGIQVGNLTIFSSNGDIVTTGNINTAGTAQFDQDTLGNVQFSNTTISTTTAGYDLILDPISGANVSVIGNANVSGNLVVSGTTTIVGCLVVTGTTTTISSTSLDVSDLNITVAKGAADPAAANDAGIDIDGAVSAGNSVKFRYSSAANVMTLNTGMTFQTQAANVTIAGNLFLSNPTRLNSGPTSVQPKAYIDLMSIVFGS